MRITILAYFLTETLNWQVLWDKEKYLLNSLYVKSKNKVSLKQMLTVKNLSLSKKNKQIKGQIYSSTFLNSIKLKQYEKFWKLQKIREKMSVCVNIHISKIICMPTIHMYTMYANCWTLLLVLGFLILQMPHKSNFYLSSINWQKISFSELVFFCMNLRICKKRN